MHSGVEFLKVRTGGIHKHRCLIRSSVRPMFYSRTALSNCVDLEHKNAFGVEILT